MVGWYFLQEIVLCKGSAITAITTQQVQLDLHAQTLEPPLHSKKFVHFINLSLTQLFLEPNLTHTDLQSNPGAFSTKIKHPRDKRCSQSR